MTPVTAHPSPLQFAAGLTRGEPLPSRRHENWRWSDLARVLRERPPESPHAALSGEGPFAGLAGRGATVVNGVGTANFARLEGSAAFALRIVSDATGSGHEARFRLQVASGAAAVLFESYEGRGDGYFSNTLLEIALDPGARLERIVLLDEPDSAVSVSTAEVRLSPGAGFAQTVLAGGARLQRHETHVHHPGAGAEVRLDGLYVMGASRHADLTTVVDHLGPGGNTAQLTKGVVRDSARGVFQGRITVREGADQTDARMGHHALILSDRAEVDAKPELEIWADDVSCAHGNTVGALDADALFYARSRGMDEAAATALLTEAFLGEVVDRIQHEGARERARLWLIERLR